MKHRDRLDFVSYKGQQVLVIDFSNCSAEDVCAIADQAQNVITAQRRHSVLVLADFTGAKFTREAAARIKTVATHDRPFVRRAVWVHAGNLPKVLHDAIETFSQREFPTFETREQALEFLVPSDEARLSR